MGYAAHRLELADLGELANCVGGGLVQRVLELGHPSLKLRCQLTSLIGFLKPLTA